jgi:hypothetical protein
MHQVNAEMKSCIEECLRCYQICLSTAMVNIPRPSTSALMACAEICQTSAHFMLIGSELHKRTCRLCNEICEQCAADCERIGEMKEAWTPADGCAESCKKMAERIRRIPLAANCFAQAVLGCNISSGSIDGRRALPQDLAAGLTLAAIAIPEQMATAQLGGLPPEIGFFAFLAGSLAFAVLGASRFLSCGADSTIRPIFAALLSTTSSSDYAALAAEGKTIGGKRAKYRPALIAVRRERITGVTRAFS